MKKLIFSISFIFLLILTIILIPSDNKVVAAEELVFSDSDINYGYNYAFSDTLDNFYFEVVSYSIDIYDSGYGSCSSDFSFDDGCYYFCDSFSIYFDVGTQSGVYDFNFYISRFYVFETNSLDDFILIDVYDDVRIEVFLNDVVLCNTFETNFLDLDSINIIDIEDVFRTDLDYCFDLIYCRGNSVIDLEFFDSIYGSSYFEIPVSNFDLSDDFYLSGHEAFNCPSYLDCPLNPYYLIVNNYINDYSLLLNMIYSNSYIDINDFKDFYNFYTLAEFSELYITDMDFEYKELFNVFNEFLFKQSYDVGFNDGNDNGYKGAVNDFTNGENLNFTLDSIDYITFDFALSKSPNVSATGVYCTGLIYDSDDGFGFNIFDNNFDYGIELTPFFDLLDSYVSGDILLSDFIKDIHSNTVLTTDYKYFIGGSENGSYASKITIHFKDNINLDLNYSYRLTNSLYKSVYLNIYDFDSHVYLGKADLVSDGNFNLIYDYSIYGDFAEFDSNDLVSDIVLVFNQYNFVNNDFPNYNYFSSIVNKSSYQDGLASGYDKGYNTGYNDGKDVANNKLEAEYDRGYQEGYNVGYYSGYEVNDFSLQSLFWTIGGLPFESFKQIWNVDFLGVNLGNFCTGIMLAAIALFVVKKVFK